MLPDECRHRGLVFYPADRAAVGVFSAFDQEQSFGFGGRSVELLGHGERDLLIQLSVYQEDRNLEDADLVQRLEALVQKRVNWQQAQGAVILQLRHLEDRGEGGFGDQAGGLGVVVCEFDRDRAAQRMPVDEGPPWIDPAFCKQV